MFEFCAGSASLSKFLYLVGFDPIAVDHHFNRHQQQFPCINFDLSADGVPGEVADLINDEDVAFCHFAPPCGTCSRAREIDLGHRGQPMPLRSDAEPWGLASLGTEDRRRVESANRVYKNLDQIVSLLDKLGVPFAVENPRSSRYWMLPGLLTSSTSSGGLIDVDFQDCAFGGGTPKWCRWRSKFIDLSSLARKCDGLHEHVPWRRRRSDNFVELATKDTAQYPDDLCKSVAALVAENWRRRGGVLTDRRPEELQLASPPQGGDRQARGAPGAYLIGELRKTKMVIGELEDPASLVANKTVSKVYKVFEGGVNAKTKTVIVGVDWSPEEFLKVAVGLSHPFEEPATLPADVREAAEWRSAKGAYGVVAHRAAQMTLIKSIAADPRASRRTAELMASASTSVATILKGKNLGLMERLLHITGYPDVNLIADIASGASLVGEAPRTGVFRETAKKVQPVPQQLLKKVSIWKRKKVEGLVANPVGDQADWAEEIYDTTLKELEEGWLTGPYEAAELDAVFPGGWLAARRFGIRQGTAAKLRVIDDYSVAGTNEGFSASEVVDLHGVDTLAAYIRTLMELHPGCQLSGTTIDLAAAYRQLALDDAEGWSACVACWDPKSKKVRFYRQAALPFGAAASVPYFNRPARAINFLGIKLFRLGWTNYLDDYPLVEEAITTPSAVMAAKFLLDGLGWRWAESKFEAPGPEFEPLGAHFDLAGAPGGTIAIDNKESRKVATEERITNILDGGVVTGREEAGLAGSLQYAMAQCFGRCGGPALSALYKRAGGACSEKPVGRHERVALEWLRAFLASCTPRVVKACPKPRVRPVIVRRLEP